MSSAPQIPAATISQLPAAGTILGPEIVAIVQNGVTVQTTVSKLASSASVVSINGLKGPLNIVGGSNVTVSSAGSTITINASGIPAGSNLQVQYNNSGVLGGYTNAQLTALINSFTSGLSGATPASGGGTSNFLRADGSWAVPSGSGGNVSSSITSTNNEVAVYSGTSGTTLTNSFFVLAGPTTPAKTYTFPNASCSILTTNAAVTGAQGGTGVSNSGLTITLGGNISTAGALTTAGAFITSGANSLTLTTTGGTNVTLPTSGTLVNTISSSIAFTGGTINGVVIGGSTPAAGTFTTLTASTSFSAATINITGSSTPANGLSLPSANTLAISANTLISAEFLSVASASNGVDFLTFTNAAASGQSSITAPTALTAALAGTGAGNLSAGNYKYKLTFISPTGETALGAASNTINVTAPLANGQMSLTAIPTSANGTVIARNLYRTTAGGSVYLFLHQIANNSTTTYTDNIADTSLTFSGPSSQAQVPVYVNVALATNGGDTSIGYIFNAPGTTTTGFQYNGQVSASSLQTSTGDTITSGGYLFQIAGATAVKITDTYWNPAQTYPGTPNGYLVLSSGSNVSGYAGAGDIICGAISVESPEYPGTVTGGVSLLIGSKGPEGQIHFIGNGALGHVTIAAAQGANPVANDVYALPTSLRFAGSMPGSGFNPVIYTQYGGGSGDSALGLTFYIEGTGGYLFGTDNLNTTICTLARSGSVGGDGLNITAQTSGSGPIIQALGSTNAPITIAAKGTGQVNIYNGSQLAAFAGGTSSTNYVEFAASSSSNNVGISAQGSGSGYGIILYTASTGNITLATNNTNNIGLVITNTKDTVPLGLSASAIATSATGGFLYMTACAGKPTGVPTNASTGNVPTVYDSTDKQTWFYDNATTSWLTDIGTQTISGAAGTLTLTAKSTILLVTTSSVAASFALPVAGLKGRLVTMIDYTGTAGTNNITTTVASSGLINGSSSAVVTNSNYAIIIFYDNGTSWNM